MTESVPAIHAGFSLPQYYYCSHEAFRRDVEVLSDKQWLLVDHASSIPSPGDFVVHDVLGESIILIRGVDGIHAWYNVCTHRGSRICLEQAGNAKMLTCPYHAWSFKADGTLQAAPAMPEGFQKSGYSLHACHIGVIEGLIFLNLSRQEPPDFDEFSRRFGPLLRRSGIGSAKVAHRRRYRSAANWKLVAENNFECYHCRANHPALVAANPGILGEIGDQYEAWKERAVAHGDWIDPFFDPADSDHLQMGVLFELGRGAVSATLDGKAVSPAMPAMQGRPSSPSMPAAANLSETSASLMFNPMSWMSTVSDYAVLYRYAPVSPTETDYEVTWLVNVEAREDIDYDLDRLVALWDVTTREDKTIVVNNQVGVGSRAYKPGPYSLAETRVGDFIRWYARLLST